MLVKTGVRSQSVTMGVKTLTRRALSTLLFLVPVYELYGQSQPNRQGCHVFALHDQPIAFCELFGVVCILWRGCCHEFCKRVVVNMHLSCFQLCATRWEWKHQWKHRWVLSHQKPKPVRAASERQYIPASRECKVPCGGVHEWRKAEQGDWQHRVSL